jgi:hypothetical protein
LTPHKILSCGLLSIATDTVYRCYRLSQHIVVEYFNGNYISEAAWPTTPAFKCCAFFIEKYGVLKRYSTSPKTFLERTERLPFFIFPD